MLKTIFENKGWQKSTSPEVCLRIKILAATEEYDQEIGDFSIEQLENCSCHSCDNICSNCSELLPVEEYFRCVGFNQLLKNISIDNISSDATLVINGTMEWNVMCSSFDGDYHDESKFIISNYRIEQ